SPSSRSAHSHSSCKAKIRVTDHAAHDTVLVRHLIAGLRALGYPIANDKSATTLYNDNLACVQRSHNMTMKCTRHMDNRETAVREWVQDGSLNVVHFRGRINPADIFTKEMKDSAHLCRLHDSFMMRTSSFSSSATTPSSAAATPATQVLASEPGLLEFIMAAQCLHERKHFLHLSKRAVNMPRLRFFLILPDSYFSTLESRTFFLAKPRTPFWVLLFFLLVWSPFCRPCLCARGLPLTSFRSGVLDFYTYVGTSIAKIPLREHLK
ncbi:hypothetical protein ACHAWF_002118, partial [Thalassiosira exigua]